MGNIFHMVKPILYIYGMQHNESTVKVYVTTDYARFNMVLGNRQLVDKTCKQIRKDVVNGLNLFSLRPIHVTENGKRLDIQDGQNRFYVCRQMKLPVYYILGNPMPMTDVAKVNSVQEKWNPKDFINCYEVQDNANYKGLREFIEETGFPLSISVRLLSKGYALMETILDKNGFERGSFVISHGIIAREVAVMVRKFSEFPKYKTGGFIVAICRLMKAEVCDMEELVAKFKKDPAALKDQAKTQDYLLNLEQIYNKGTHSRRVIY